ncbi:hypothetical protein E2C01_080738 [Portunus trituberculatus]|uniref:Uncharacterized protein n=1 Tax=Portunus trituberculatus TaxID=210409 RepID=A0A5B7IQ53_PORTR|nr:hypothetical protein [Portunus trituberculatus]
MGSLLGVVTRAAAVSVPVSNVRLAGKLWLAVAGCSDGGGGRVMRQYPLEYHSRY